MDVADQIVLMNRGRVEQVGSPRELYEKPANEFVMTFVGPVSSLGGEYIRPHDLELLLEPGDGTTGTTVQRVVHLGFEVRVELQLDDDGELSAQVTRGECERLGLAAGVRTHVRPRRARVFAEV